MHVTADAHDMHAKQRVGQSASPLHVHVHSSQCTFFHSHVCAPASLTDSLLRVQHTPTRKHGYCHGWHASILSRTQACSAPQKVQDMRCVSLVESASPCPLAMMHGRYSNLKDCNESQISAASTRIFAHRHRQTRAQKYQQRTCKHANIPCSRGHARIPNMDGLICFALTF